MDSAPSPAGGGSAQRCGEEGVEGEGWTPLGIAGPQWIVSLHPFTPTSCTPAPRHPAPQHPGILNPCTPAPTHCNISPPSIPAPMHPHLLHPCTPSPMHLDILHPSTPALISPFTPVSCALPSQCSLTPICCTPKTQHPRTPISCTPTPQHPHTPTPQPLASWHPNILAPHPFAPQHPAPPYSSIPLPCTLSLTPSTPIPALPVPQGPSCGCREPKAGSSAAELRSEESQIPGIVSYY